MARIGQRWIKVASFETRAAYQGFDESRGAVFAVSADDLQSIGSKGGNLFRVMHLEAGSSLGEWALCTMAEVFVGSHVKATCGFLALRDRKGVRGEVDFVVEERRNNVEVVLRALEVPSKIDTSKPDFFFRLCGQLLKEDW